MTTVTAAQLQVHVHMDARLARAGVAGLLEEQHGVQVVGDTGGTDDLLDAIAAQRPEVAVIDASGSAVALGDLVTRVRRASPSTGVLVIAQSASGGLVEAALRAGAQGFMVWDVSPDELVDAIRTVGRGDAVLHPKAAAVAGARLRGDDPMRLTPRQTEVIALLVDGLPNKQIARRLGIAVETVKTHLERIFERLEVGSRTEAVAVAMRQGVV